MPLPFRSFRQDMLIPAMGEHGAFAANSTRRHLSLTNSKIYIDLAD
jgi:hypothetical protein